MSGGEKVSESTYAEQPALEWLMVAGWTHVHGSQLRPDSPAPVRSHWSDVVLIGRLRAAVERLNPELPADAVQRVVELALTVSSPDPVLDHEDFHELLIAGVPISWLDADGIERSGRAKLVDFEGRARNEVLAVNQFTIIVGNKNRRPDILLFVNGLPLGQIELKNPADETATPQTAVNQVAHYRDTIPGLYRYVELIGVSDLLRARLGSITTPPEHFAEWKSIDEAENAERTQLELLIRGVFAPERLLDMARNFVLFESDGRRTQKIVAKYHQVDAVSRAVESAAAAMDTDGRAGIVWHTQGAGKTYTQVFFVTKIRRDPRFENPTVLCVTDTNDLDNQLHGAFARQKHLGQIVRQAERIRGTPDALYELLDVPADYIVFTTIQKFGRGRDDEPMPVLSERRNVVVLADEAHRSQYARLAQNLAAALPNATRIGFTGTPLERADRNTRVTFGDYISIYRMDRAQEDRSTVPIYYESRQVPVAVDDEHELRRLEDVLEGEGEEAERKLTTAWARLERVVGAPERLDRVVEDLVGHFRDRCRTLNGKAIVVAYSRRIAAEYAERVKAELGPDAATAVITAAATDEPRISAYRRSKREMAELAEKFKDPGSELRVVVVKDMWLTGFDVPCLHTLYVDKPMRDHGLLQAIARVNRVFRDKPGGLVVDYIGIGDDLRASLTAYDDADVDDVVISLEEAVKRLREKHEVLLDLVHGIDFRPLDGQGAAERATRFAKCAEQAADRFVGDEEKARVFLSEQMTYSRWFALVSPHEESILQRYDHDFFAAVAKTVRAILTEEGPVSGDPSVAAERAVEQFFSDGLGAGEVIDVLEVAGAERPEVSVLSDEFLDSIGTRVERPNLQVALLRKLLDGEIRVRLSANRTQASRFSERLQAVLDRYEARQLTSAEVVKHLVELAKELRDTRRRNEKLGLSAEEVAFYDALAGHSDDWKADPELAEIAADLVRSIRSDLSVDWTDRANVEAAIRARIKRLLRKHHYSPPVRRHGGAKQLDFDSTAQLILDQAREIYRYWPEVEADRLFV